MPEKCPIFLVDDDELYLDATEHFLLSNNRERFLINKYQTGEACLKDIEKKKPSVVILDYNLSSSSPNALNGIGVLRKIKEFNPKTNVIMLSAYDDVNIAVEAIENGASDYICKSKSSFVKIRNIVINIARHNDVTGKLQQEVSIYKKISIGLICLLILLFILSRL
jgi:two-component system, OmpR family, response regulator